MSENVQFDMFQDKSRLAPAFPDCGGDTVAAFLCEEDFEIARTFVDGFMRWTSYEDFALDTEGLVMGMAMAGKASYLLPISLTAFVGWLNYSGEQPTLSALDAFAYAIHSFRRARAEGVPAPAATLTEIGLPTLEHYESWLDTLGSLDSLQLWASLPGPETYAELLLESWSA